MYGESNERQLCYRRLMLNVYVIVSDINISGFESVESTLINPLPHIPILSSSNSDKDICHKYLEMGIQFSD